jgi:hypothetical protein
MEYLPNDKPSVLFITDLYYKANKRDYYLEDLYLTSQLKEDFDIILCHPLHSLKFEQLVDLVIIRNSGPVIYYKEYFDDFFERVKSKYILTYNSFDGGGDMLGKRYLIDLFKAGFPVIPTVGKAEEIHLLPFVETFIVKPKEGADSIGMRQLSAEEITLTDTSKSIIQPYIDFVYEVSFYFIDGMFQYALYAPNKNERWKLQSYTPTPADLAFAQLFVDWNTMKNGIQRVDACRTKDGNLLLVELEDLNPFLSLDLLNNETRDGFINNFKRSIHRLLAAV